MMTMNEKLIYSDVDDVMVEWLKHFHEHATELGYKTVDETCWNLNDRYGIPVENVDTLYLDFNASEKSLYFEGVKNIHYAKKISDEFGYKYVLVSACGESQKGHPIYDNRIVNVSGLIGEENIHSLYCTRGSAEKRAILERDAHTGKVWIEDNINNAIMGYELGYKTFLFNRKYNLGADVPEGIQRVECWEEIYSEISTLEKSGI